MNKQDIINTVADSAVLSKKDAKAAVNAVFQTITDSLANGESVQLIGFGTFSTADRAEREGTNPSTGQKITIPATTVAKFKVGAALKEAVK